MERRAVVAAHLVAKGRGTALCRRAFIAGLKTNDERPTGETEKQLTTSSRRSALRHNAAASRTRKPGAPAVLRAAVLHMLFSSIGIAAAKQKEGIKKEEG
jgi:hypothetical protein